MKQQSKKFMILLICAVLAVGVIFGIVVARVGNVNKICPGVWAGGVSLSNLTEEEAEEKLRKQLQDITFDKPIHLVLGNVEKTVVPSDFLAAYDYRKTAEKVLEYAHTGSTFKKFSQALRSFFVPKHFGMEISYDETAYQEAIDSLMTGVGEKVQEHTWEVKGDKLLFKNGQPGLLPDEISVSDAIIDTISKGEYKDKIVFKKENRTPSAIDADLLYTKVCAEASDASYAIEDGKVIMHPHVLGISFDVAKAQELLDTHTAYGETFEIPLQIQKPQVMLEDIEARLFSRIIGEYTTVFKTGDVSRSKNISLATNKIDGTILAPDEVFSYNDVVGERSYSEGFQDAKVYVNGETVDGIGGGICQVSSTLFNAVVFANLEIVERVNHQLTISYVPLGRDATVDYGNIDFRFRNNTGYPVKIVGSAENGKMHIAIYGYKENESETVSFETVTIGHTAPPEKKVDDPTLPLGEEKVESEGTSGYVVDTYKIIKRDGEEPERVYLCRSTYRGNLKIIRVGTGEAVPSPEPGEEPGVSPLPVEGPTDVPPSSKPTQTPDAPVPEVQVPAETPEVPDETTETPKETEPVSDTGL